MGRKRDELKFGCFADAEDDEMIFVLRTTDECAPDAIRYWCEKRIERGKNEPGDSKILEAEACADVMRGERDARIIRKAIYRMTPAERKILIARICQGCGNFRSDCECMSP